MKINAHEKTSDVVRRSDFNSNNLIAFAKRLKGETLTTQARQVEFSVEAYGTGLRYNPTSTGKLRPEPLSALVSVLNQFNATGSLKPGDYQKATFNASYTLALVKQFIDEPRSELIQEKD